jgi:DNA end-binding protein Ku
MRASWKGHLRLQLVSCPVKLFPGTSRASRVSFHNLNPETEHRINLRPHDPETGDEVAKEDIVKGYEVEKGRFVVLEAEEIEKVRIASTKVIELERFIDPGEMNPAFLNAPYFVAPDGAVAEETYRVIREAMVRKGKIGLGRVVLSRRERMVIVEPRGRGILMTTLHAKEEVRPADAFFADIEEGKLDEEMVDLAAHIIAKKSGKFDPDEIVDRYQAELVKLVQAKMKGEKPVLPKPSKTAEVIDLKEALKRSLASEKGGKRSPQRRRRKA